MSAAEDIAKGSLYEYWVSQYDKYKIGDKFHISFDDYIARPRFKIDILNRAAEQIDTRIGMALAGKTA